MVGDERVGIPSQSVDLVSQLPIASDDDDDDESTAGMDR